VIRDEVLTSGSAGASSRASCRPRPVVLLGQSRKGSAGASGIGARPRWDLARDRRESPR